MLPLPKGAAPKFILLFLVSLLIKEISSEGRVVCYYTNWSVYRPGTAKFNPQNINPYLCTHLIYAFGGFTKDNTLKPFDKYQDIEQGGYSKFTGLKAYNKNLKTLLAIGGWNEGSSRFSPLVASSERRQQFIKNILKFLRQNHFDGLDLDWEYPAFRDGGKLRDKENYAQFVQELRSEFDRESSKTGRPRLLLTMAVPAGTEYIEKGYDIPKLNRYLDWFNLLSYDYHSAYEPSVNHHSPLYSLEEESEYNYDADLNIDYSVKFYLQAGADRDKLVLGIPTYGRTYTLVSEDITELGSPADGPGDQGDATREKGYLAYYEICQSLRDDPDWTVVQPNSKAMGPYAFRGNQWVGYDDEAIVKKKAEYVVENGLGGIMFWSIDNDDFRGSCGKKPYPLIEAAKEAMLDRLGLGDNEVARPSPPRKPSRSRSRLGSSNRNNIINESSNTHKTNQSGKKSSSRRNSNKKRLNRVTSTTTTTTTTTTPSSLYIGGRSTTPPPPTTPDPGADFKCEEEGFFAHPRDCKKYFWCLDSGPSNLGIVAHQFTCPSGLYFNTAADSCDFSRNVLCKTKTTTAKPTTTTAPITTSTTIRTTTNSPRITAATSRQTFLRHTSTTEQPSEEEEYEDDDEDESVGPEEEEDPKVIKELIQLIKKVGGLEELEKQLLQQEDGSMVLSNAKSDVSSTTPSTISKSLYHKVLSRPNNLSSFRRQFETNKLARSTVSPSLREEEDSVEVEESSQKSDSRYSSVVRNSRPSPQNAGIDKLPEFEGFLKEKPKYVTIQRTRPTVAVESNFDEEENDDVSTEFVEQSTRDSKNRRVDVVTTQTTTVTPSYVNIRRTRPSTAAPESSEITEDDKIISSTRSSYLPLNRRRISTVTTATDEVTTAPSTGTPFASTTQRYKYIERTKSSTLQPEEIKTTTGFSKINFNNVDENSSPITVQNLELNEYTTQAPIQKIATTHIYENIARRTTFSTTPSSTLVETTTAEPTTIRAFTTTNPTTTTLSSSTNSAPLLEQDPTPVDNFQNQNSILPITDPSPNKSAGLDTDGKDTTELIKDKKTDKIHLIGEDEVTLTDSKVKVSSSSTLSSYNITKFNEFESSLKATNPSLSKIDKQVTVTITEKLTTPNTDITTTPQTTIQKDEITTIKDFLETVSSPRPFGFPRRRTRPTTARKPSSSTNHEIVTSTSTVTPPPTQKRRQNTRRPVLSVRRRITTSSTSSNSSEDSNLQVVDSSTSTPLLGTGNTKYTRRTRPIFSTSTIASPTTTTAVAADAKSTTNDTAKSTPKVVIRRKFGRPGGGTRRTSSTAASPLADEPAKDEGPPPAQRVANRISPSLIRRVPAAVKVLTITPEDLKNKKSEETANDLRDICNAATAINALKPTVVPNEQQIKIQMMTTSQGNITKSQLNVDEISKLETLNDNNDIVVFVNAWKSNASNENDVVSELESAYKCRGNVTLMVIDLGSIITDVQTWMTLDYIQTGAVISKAIKDFVKVSKGSKLHLIGHGMGAHIAGAAGRKYAEISGNLLFRITALDPAMLCYKEPQTISGLQRGDAEFVDVIHSSAYGLGKEEPIGDVDFFPNGPSVLQPGCQNLICAHNQAIKYFAETIIPGNEKNFISEQCNSIKNLGSNTCKQNQIAMGLSVPRSAKGNYFLKTKDKSPYGLNTDKTQNNNCNRL